MLSERLHVGAVYVQTSGWRSNGEGGGGLSVQTRGKRRSAAAQTLPLHHPLRREPAGSAGIKGPGVPCRHERELPRISALTKSGPRVHHGRDEATSLMWLTLHHRSPTPPGRHGNGRQTQVEGCPFCLVEMSEEGGRTKTTSLFHIRFVRARFVRGASKATLD